MEGERRERRGLQRLVDVDYAGALLVSQKVRREVQRGKSF
jgi:hypothetical protein